MVNQSGPNLPRAYHARSLYTTPTGEEFLEQTPEILEPFLAAGHELAQPELPPRGRYEWIGGGNASFVYGLDGYEDVCLKLVSPNTARETWMSGRPAPARVLPNLKQEARFMHKIGRHLAQRSEHGVRAPQQYAVARFAGGAVLLQERISNEFGTFTQRRSQLGYIRDEAASDAAYQEIERQAGVAYRRVVNAIGPSVLRFGVSDTKCGTSIHWGNMLIEKDRPVEERVIYAIDLVSKGFLQKRLAAGIGWAHP